MSKGAAVPFIGVIPLIVGAMLIQRTYKHPPEHLLFVGKPDFCDENDQPEIARSRICPYQAPDILSPEFAVMEDDGARNGNLREIVGTAIAIAVAFAIAGFWFRLRARQI